MTSAAELSRGQSKQHRTTPFYGKDTCTTDQYHHPSGLDETAECCENPRAAQHPYTLVPEFALWRIEVDLDRIVDTYRRQASDLARSGSATEASFYPLLQNLLNGILRELQLPFDVRVNTSERRNAGGVDLPDLAFYDGSGDFAVLLGEVKLPGQDLAELAASTERNDQVGRYLDRTGAILLTNIRSFGLLALSPNQSTSGAAPQRSRQLIQEVELWQSPAELRKGSVPSHSSVVELAELIKIAATEFAPIGEPRSLAGILASLARRARADLPLKFSNAVQPLLDDFSKALGIQFIGTEGEDFLRSSLVQTVFYSLFSGWTLWRQSGIQRPFRWEDLSEYLKIPFLAGLFHEIRHPQRMKELNLRIHLDRAQAVLGRVDTDRFFSSFKLWRVSEDDASGASHAILYFYEPFLEAFDPDLRKQLGVWYTPPEIVHYQVRKVDTILREELACSRGFADERVVVLDPCCGTGAYLLEVVRCIVEQLKSEGAGAILPRKVLEACCKRVLGFEILTAPYVVAQLQLYLTLSSLGATPDEEHRPAVFLTNALTGWDGPEQLKLNFPELQQEHDSAQRVKRDEKIIVIIGNPPYNRWATAPVKEEADLVDHYKGVRRDSKGRALGRSELYTRFGIRKQLLDDLYVRFVRLAEARIGEKAEHGVVSFISNYSFLAGRSHPLMRESLLRSFDKIWIDSLNGDKYRTGKVIPEGQKGAGTSDQSVFSTDEDSRGIQVGTAITTLLKKQGSQGKTTAEVLYRDFWGLSIKKRQALVLALKLDSGQLGPSQFDHLPEGPKSYSPVPISAANRWKLTPMDLSSGFEAWPSIDDLFPSRFQGVNPARGLEGSLVDTDKTSLAERMREYYSRDISFESLNAKHPELLRERAEYSPRQVREKLLKTETFSSEKIVQYQLFPLDLRYIYYETEAKLLTRRSPKIWDNLNSNRFLIAVNEPRQESETKPLTSTTLFDYHLHDRGSFGFPVHVTLENHKNLFTENAADIRIEANLAPTAWAVFKQSWGIEGTLEDPPARALVGMLFDCTLAIGHSPQYEHEHADSLAQDWLHIPIPRDRNEFLSIASLGRQIALLLDPLMDASIALEVILGSGRHSLAVITKASNTPLMESDLIVTFNFSGSAAGAFRERTPPDSELLAGDSSGAPTGDLFLNSDLYLANVPRQVWEYKLGGYPVIKKWLSYRDSRHRGGRGLEVSELEILRENIQRVAALTKLYAAIDSAYESAIKNSFSAAELGLD